MSTKLAASVVVVVLAIILLGITGQNSAITNAEASLASAQQTNEGFLESYNTSQNTTLVIVLLATGALALIWFKNLQRLFTNGRLSLILAIFLSVSLTACGATARKAVTQPNEVTFMVQLQGDNSNQAVIGEIPQQGQVEYWKQNLVRTSEVTIEQYCFQPRTLGGCQYRDAVRVIAVDTRAVRIEWAAPAILRGQPFPDMSNAFAMQSVEPNGGSTGVYIGAQIIARIRPENAALYLANYGYSNTIDAERNIFPARPLIDVLQNEVRAYTQTQLNREYGQRSAVEQNNDMNIMFDIVEENLTAEFATKGISIESFGYNGGNVYENFEIQEAMNSSFERQRQLEEVQANATREAIVNGQNLDSAYAQATQTMVAAQSAADSQQLLSDILSANPGLIQYEYAKRWNGQLPQILGDSGALPMIPFTLSTPSAPTIAVTPEGAPQP